MIVTSLSQLIGHTPLLQIKTAGARVLAKLDSFNPAGSAKDRAALFMLNDAQNRGLLRPGGTVIEPTSGNTGIGLAAIAAARGYRCIIVIPESMSAERRKLIKAYGAELLLTPGDMSTAIAKAEELAQAIPGSFLPGQFTNPANPNAHYRTTGPEIWEDTDGQVDIFVAGIGTGGTITGTGHFLKEKNPQIQIIGAEPADSPVLSGGSPGPHGIQGIGAGFVPELLDTSLLDEVIPVTTEEACASARTLARTEGFLPGISGGAALHAALKIAARPENAEKTIVTLLPDSGERYLSTDLYAE